MSRTYLSIGKKMTLEKFKLAVISTDEFSDTHIEKTFLDVVMTSESDIHEAIGVLSKHRPGVLKNLLAKYPGLPTA